MKKIVNEILSRGYKLQEYCLQRPCFGTKVKHIVKLSKPKEGVYLVSCHKDGSKEIKFKAKGYKKGFKSSEYIKKHGISIEFEMTK